MDREKEMVTRCLALILTGKDSSISLKVIQKKIVRVNGTGKTRSITSIINTIFYSPGCMALVPLTLSLLKEHYSGGL